MRRSSDNKIVLIDFGAVKEIDVLTTNQQGVTTLTVAVGTPGYMPSEQSNGKPKLSSDIYAVGMVGIRALTGKDPQNLLTDSKTGNVIWRNDLIQYICQMVTYFSFISPDHISCFGVCK